MKICLIGNSHIACLGEAWSENHYGLDITFFGSHLKTIVNTKNIDNIIYATTSSLKSNFIMTSRGKDSIDLNNYDVIVIHGLIQQLINYAIHIESIKNNIYYSSEIIKKSNPFFSCACHHIVTEIRKTSGIKILCSFAPNPIQTEPSKVINEFVYKSIVDLFNKLSEEFNFEILHQPPETLKNYIYTLDRYNKGSKKFDPCTIVGTQEYSHDDTLHMNAEFGHLYLQQLKRRLDNLKPCS